jgi:O-acetyl-ADP-ribose deacetylase (regulator of RNase III)
MSHLPVKENLWSIYLACVVDEAVQKCRKGKGIAMAINPQSPGLQLVDSCSVAG